MQHSRIIATFLLVALAATAVGAQQLLPPTATDLSADTLTTTTPLKGLDVPREAVALSWPLATGDALASPEPFVSRSKEYFVDVTAEDLAQGIPVYTTRPGALVRLNPAVAPQGRPASLDGSDLREKANLEPASLVLIDAADKSWGAGSGMDLMVGPEQLKAAGAPFAEGTTAFRIREELGAGAFTLRADGLSPSGDRYVMHVFDRASPVSLELTTGASDYLHGQTLTVEASLTGSSKALRVRAIEGFVSSPAGRAWPLNFRRAGKGLYRATLTLDALETPAPGLWEVHTSANGLTGGQAVMRVGRTAFACAVPSARFSGAAEVTADGLGFSLGVETASPGRFEARGVLYATTGDGILRPAGVAHSAAWLEAGQGALVLNFDRQLLTTGDLGAPFELRDLRLVDQVRMGLLHRQERALTVGK